MSELDRIIGADNAFTYLKNLLEGSHASKVFLQGPDGRGKTKIATEISKYFTQEEYCCIELHGDESRYNEDFYPLKQFIERKEKSYKKGVSVIKESIGGIPYIGRGIKAIIDDYDFKGKKKRKTISDVYPLSSHIDFSLHLISLKEKYERLIIICDDFDHFDDKTIAYIADLKQGFLSLNETFNIQFLFVVEKIESSINLGKFDVLQLPPLNRDQINRVVMFFAGKKLSATELDIIESCSGGHLQLIKLISSYVKENHDTNYVPGSDDFFRQIVDTRLRGIKNQYDNLKRLFSAILQLGRKTSKLELVCLFGEENVITETIELAIQHEMLRLENTYLHFSHPIFESYIRGFYDKPKAAFLQKLSSCIKKLSPSDYKRRAVIAHAIGEAYEANILWSLAAIENMRKGLFDDASRLFNNIHNDEYNLVDVLNQFKRCYLLSSSSDIEQTLLEVEQISNAIPKELQAERIYLKCELLAKRIAIAPKQEAICLISQWEDIKEEEPEIWYRLLQLKIILSSEVGVFDVGVHAETEIVKFYSSRLTYDPGARNILQRINLFSEVLYTPEIANRRILQAERYFTKQVENEHFLQIIDLFVARTNLSSNYLLLNDLDKAIEFAKSAMALVKAFKFIKFPDTEAPLSNLCLALWFSEETEISYITNIYKQIYDEAHIEENKLLIDINYAGFLLFDNRVEEAFEILEFTNYIPEQVVDDAYYFYYFWSNYMLLLVLLDKRDMALTYLPNLQFAAETVSVSLKKYYTKHYQLLTVIVNSDNIKTLKDVQVVFEKNASYFSSPIWERFKLGYLLTDIQIWLSN